MERIEQEDILRISGYPYPNLVISNNYFNQNGAIIVCPILSQAELNPLHFNIETDQLNGYALCEQVHYVNISRRHFSKISNVDYFFMMDVSDAVMGMFDYQTV